MNFPDKDLPVMVRHGLSLESPLEHQRDYLTPVNRFFVCNSGSTPSISAQEYSLRIWGDGVQDAIVLSYEDLCAMPQRSVSAVIECAGNHRAFFKDVDGQSIETPPGTEELIWSTGAVGMAEWTGVSLASVLRKAGLVGKAMQVCATGSESDSVEGTVRLPLPVEKAVDEDTLLVLQMNGQPLTADHGYPVRVLVPGYIGAYSIKWVQDIEVSCTPIWVRRNTKSYVMMGKSWPADQYAPSQGMPITCLNIKSALALPLPAELASGEHRLHGFARSPGSKILTVQWSDDEGLSWYMAKLVGKNEKYGWVKFEFDWTARSGNHKLMTRAEDEVGHVQPASVPFNSGGYLYNAVHPHPVEVKQV